MSQSSSTDESVLDSLDLPFTVLFEVSILEHRRIRARLARVIVAVIGSLF
jgi:hypothetical protein